MPKISQLATKAAPEAADLLAVVDVAAGASKAVRLDGLKGYMLPSAVEAVGKAASGVVIGPARRQAIVPSPAYIAPASVGTSDRAMWMSADGTKLWAGNGTALKVSTDDGATWTTIWTAPRQVKGVRQLANGQLLVSVERTNGSAAGALYLSSDYGTNPSAPTMALVLTAFDDQCAFTNEWSLSTSGSIVVASEYGTYGHAIHVYLSRDSGATWTTIFDLVAMFGADSATAHVHGVAYDPYWQRIWVCNGDAANRAIRYSDALAPSAAGDWTTLSSGLGTPQPVGILPLPNCILLSQDSNPNGVLRIWRRDKSVVPSVEYEAYVLEQSDVVSIVGGMSFWRGAGYPALIAFVRSSSGPAYLVGTYDGTDFFTLWTDPNTYNTPNGLECALGPTATGKIVGDLLNTTSFRLTWTAPAWSEIKNRVPLAKMSRYLRLPNTSSHGAGTPARAMHTATEFDIRARLSMDDWTPGADVAITGQFDAAADKNLVWMIRSTGVCRLQWYPDGTTLNSKNGTIPIQTAVPTLLDGDPITLRLTGRGNNGSAVYQLDAYYSTDYDPVTQQGTWTLWESMVGGATTTFRTTSADPWEIGGLIAGQNNRMQGNVEWVEYRNGVAGAVLASPDFRQPCWQVGDTVTSVKIPANKDAQGNLWTLINVARVQALPGREALTYLSPVALTQTYATAARTLNAYTTNAQSSAYTGAADSEAKLADLNLLRLAYENLRASHDNLMAFVNGLVDELQRQNLIG